MEAGNQGTSPPGNSQGTPHHKGMEATTLKPVTKADGTPSLALDDVLEAEADNWAKWWGEGLATPTLPRDHTTGPIRDKLTPEQVKNTARSFKPGTSRADAWRPRHYGDFSDTGLEWLPHLLHICELVGNFPQVLQ